MAGTEAMHACTIDLHHPLFGLFFGCVLMAGIAGTLLHLLLRAIDRTNGINPPKDS